MDMNLGARIRELRELRGLTQRLLAERAGLGVFQTISDIELGRREIKAAELVRLARALEASIDDLLGLGTPESQPRVFWRRGDRNSDSLREARLLRWARQQASLEAWCEEQPSELLPDVAFDPARASVGDAWKLADQVGRALDLGGVPAASLVTTLENTYGVKIFYEDLADAADVSAACVRGDFGAAILMDASEAPWRRNFSFAHELFHLVTWTSVGDAWSNEGESPWYDRLEKLANAFASHLLLPADAVQAEVLAHATKLDDGTTHLDDADLIFIAHSKFHVSTLALLWRLVNLRVISSEECDRLANDQSFARLDRADMIGLWNRPPVPFSDRYRQLAVRAFRRGFIGLSKLSDLLETPIAEVQRHVEGDADSDRTSVNVEIAAAC